MLEVGIFEVFGVYINPNVMLRQLLFAKSNDEQTNNEAEDKQDENTSSDTQSIDDSPPDLGINVNDDFASGDIFGG